LIVEKYLSYNEQIFLLERSMSLNRVEVVIFGPQNSGKSNLVNFLTEKHPKFGEKPIEYIESITTSKDKMTLSNSDEMINIYYKQYKYSSDLTSKNPKIALFCFDLSDKESELVKNINEYKKRHPLDIILLVGTKKDRCNQKNHSNIEYILQQGANISSPVYSTSSKENTGIDALKQAIQDALPDVTNRIIQHTTDNIKSALSYASKNTNTEINKLLKQLDDCKTFKEKMQKLKNTTKNIAILARLELINSLKHIDYTRKNFIIKALDNISNSKDQKEFESHSKLLIISCKDLFKDHSALNQFLKVLIPTIAALAVFLTVSFAIAFSGLALGSLFYPVGLVLGVTAGVTLGGATGGGLAYLFFKPSPQENATELLDKALELNTQITISEAWVNV
jgi:GTP-binding protein EngB required for normal cell division